MTRKRSLYASVGGMVALAAWPWTVAAQDLRSLEDDAVRRVQEYLRVDTYNPPGNESNAVAFFARIFDAEGIAYETAESAPGRGNIWARLEGGDQPALVLLHHSDVVPADPSHWTVDPLSGVERNGYVYGRGALDTKTGGILHLQTFLALHRSGRSLNRDVIFMATADEEAGGFFGAGWMVEQRPEVFEGVGLLLNEGDGGTRIGDRVEFGVEVTQKVPVWLRLTAVGEPGHGSTPRSVSSVTRLLQALENIRNHPFRARIIPAVDDYFKALAPQAEPAWRAAFADMPTAIEAPGTLARLQLYNPFFHALTRNTCSITRLEGSSKINVVPPEASAELDCRLLPDQDQRGFLEELRTVINDPRVEIETLMAFSPAVSTTDTELFRAIEQVTRSHYPDSRVIPAVASGFTDSHFFRDLGITSYGFFPLVVPAEDDGGVHGNDERVLVSSIREGTRMMYEIVSRVVY